MPVRTSQSSLNHALRSQPKSRATPPIATTVIARPARRRNRDFGVGASAGAADVTIERRGSRSRPSDASSASGDSFSAPTGEALAVSSVDAELLLIAVAAMLSPTTMTFSVLTLVLAKRPLRSGLFFYIGAFGATLGIGLIAAFALGDAAATGSDTPKTWVAVLDVVAAMLLLAYVARVMQRPRDPARTASMVAKLDHVVSGSAIAVIVAGATLANPGGFIPIALKSISQLDPSAAAYLADWTFFAFVSLLPLAVAIVLLMVAPTFAKRLLRGARGWLELHARTIAALIIVLLAATLLRNGIAALV